MSDICMSHGTHANESRHTHVNEPCHRSKSVMAHIYTSPVAYEWVMSSLCMIESCPVCIRMSHVVYMYECVMSRVLRVNESWHTYARAMWRINKSYRLCVWLSHFWSTYEWAMSCMCMNVSCRVTCVWMSHSVSLCVVESWSLYTNEPCHACVWTSRARVSCVWMSHVKSRAWISHVVSVYDWVMSCPSTNEPRRAYVWMSHVAWLACEWAIACLCVWWSHGLCIRMSHVVCLGWEWPIILRSLLIVATPLSTCHITHTSRMRILHEHVTSRMSKSHVTHMNVSCHTYASCRAYERHISQILRYMCHDSFIRVPWLIHTRAMTHSYACHDSFICVTGRVMSRIWKTYIANINEACHAYERVMSRVWVSRAAHLNETWLACEQAILHERTSFVTHMTKS